MEVSTKFSSIVGSLKHGRVHAMCDYSLQDIPSRPAKVGDELITKTFISGTRGFALAADPNTAVCLLPGTELVFTRPIHHYVKYVTDSRGTAHTTAIFRQVDANIEKTHHDALEFPDGEVVTLHYLEEDQLATVLQLPAQPAHIEGGGYAPTHNPDRELFGAMRTEPVNWGPKLKGEREEILAAVEANGG